MDTTTDFSGLFTPQSDDLTFEALLERVQELEERVAMQSIDRLTSVLSADQFFFEVHRILTEYPDLNFVMWRFDIDKFQTVNNLFGVDEGNRLLIYCAKYLKNSLPTSGSTAMGRMGGDVFCGITPYSDMAMTTGDEGNHWLTATSTLTSMEPFLKGFRPDFRFSVSIGFYQIEDHQDPFEIMYSRALAASKSCKDNSEQMYAFYDRALNAAMEETQMITAEMHAALENGEFTVFLQPKVRLSDLSLVGAEALVRWIHPKKGRVPPDSFIPIFEENGFITKLDLYVLRRCCAYIQSWMRQGMNLIPISVNLSQIDLCTPGLPFKIMAVLDEYKVPPKYIHLEITESAYADDVEQVNGVTNAFKELGFHLEMDDFGKGYSSLNMIAELPIDTLKLDMRFLQGDYQGGSGKVISFVTGLARHMSLVTVAEGIETQEQLAFLRSINCDCGQGYFFSRPLPKGDFDAYMRSCSIAPVGLVKIKHADKSIAEYNGWNTQDIWEPDSSFSKIFNAFSGGVGICELNVLQNTFRLCRFNQSFADILQTNHEMLKQHCDSIVELIHPADMGQIYSALSKFTDPKDWGVDLGSQSADLRVRILDENSDQPDYVPSYTWVRLRWTLVDFSRDTRTYIVQLEDASAQYQEFAQLKERLSSVDDLERQMKIFTGVGIAGAATIRFPRSNATESGEITYGNQQFFKICQLEDKFSITPFPQPVHLFFHSPESQKLLQRFQGLLESEETSFEWVISTLDAEGDLVSLVTNGLVRREPSGIYFDLVLSRFNDVSTLQSQLAISEERSQKILENTDVTYMDFNELIIRWGHDLQLAYGVPAQEPLNPHAAFPGIHLFHPDSVPVVEKMMADLIRAEGVCTVDLWMRHENYVDFSLRSATFFSQADETGKVYRISGIGRDVTLERHGKKNVTLAEIATYIPDGLLVFSASTGKLLFANAEYFNIIGISSSQMEKEFKNYPLLLINDETHNPVVALPEIQGGEGATFVRESQLKNHSMRWVALHGTLRGTYIYATVRDITVRQRLQIQLDREIGFNEILNNIADELVFQVNIQDRTVVFRGKSRENFGLPNEPMMFHSDSTHLNIIVKEHEETYFELVRDVLAGVEKTYTMQLKEQNGNVSWYRFEYRIISEAGDPAFAVGKAVNIDYEVELLAKLEQDAVSGLYNDGAMKVRTNKILKDSFPSEQPSAREVETAHALLLIRVNNYEEICENASFSQKEQIILHISQLMNRRFRESDLVGRLTEDTFVIFMQHVSISTTPLEKVADLYADFHQSTQLSPKNYNIEVTISCSFASRDGITYQELLDNGKEVPFDPDRHEL